MKMNSPRPISFFRLRGKASSTLSARLIAVPTAATNTVTPKALGMVSIPNSIRYASKVIFFGITTNPPLRVTSL
ncbi:hypothetical protein D3C75_1369390 [compost metagenome]